MVEEPNNKGVAAVRRVLRWAGMFWSVVMLLAAAGLLLAVVPVFGNRALIVRSGSMSPALGVGDLVIVRSFAPPDGGATDGKSAYEVGDLIAFRGARSDVVVTHRIVEVKREGGSVRYVSKGDANDAPDESAVTVDRVLGRKVARVPYVGWLMSFGKTKPGFIAFIVVPALLVMAGDVAVIVREVRRRKILPSPPLSPLRPRASRGTARGELGRAGLDAPLVKGGLGGIGGRSGVLVPAPITHTVPPRMYMDSLVTKVLLLVLSVGLTVPSGLAFYTDTEVSKDNALSAIESFPAGHVVISEVQIRGGDVDDDFLELYNPTGEAIDISGWKIRRKNSTGATNSLVVIPSGKSISAHGFFLWASTDNSFAEGVGADVSNSNNLTDNNSVQLRMPDDTPVDSVAWGSGTNQFVEGSAFPANPGSNQSMERKAVWDSTAGDMGAGGDDEFRGNGFDSDDNSSDFVLRGASQPQNSTTGGTEEL